MTDKGLSNFFNTVNEIEDRESIKFEVTEKKETPKQSNLSNVPQWVDQETKNDLAIIDDLKEIKRIEKEARVRAISDLRSVSDKGNRLLDLLIEQIEGGDDVEYTSNGISPQMISSVSSLINAIGNVNGKLLDDGKKRIDKLITNTQNNLTVSDSNKVDLSNKDGESSISIETTTSDILKQIRKHTNKRDDFLEGEFNE